jgi:hypothetical protein
MRGPEKKHSGAALQKRSAFARGLEHSAQRDRLTIDGWLVD